MSGIFLSVILSTPISSTMDHST